MRYDHVGLGRYEGINPRDTTGSRSVQRLPTGAPDALAGTVTDQRPLITAVARWVSPLVAAMIFFGAESLVRNWVGDNVPQKGWIAPHTVRADTDVVLDLYETQAAEAEEAKQSYVPIYNKDDEILFESKWRVLAAALSRPLEAWGWQVDVLDEIYSVSGGDGGSSADVSFSQPAFGDASVDALIDARGGDADVGGDSIAGAPYSPIVARRKEIEAMVSGLFRMLEPYYRRGVVADTEFPKEKQHIRLVSHGHYLTRGASQLHRFSDLRVLLARGASQYFFKSDPRVRLEVIDFVLQRLPANVSYAEENEKFIADIAQITGHKVVLIKRGTVLVGQGQMVDTRAHHAIQASRVASRQTTWWARTSGRCFLIAALLFAFLFAVQGMCSAVFARIRTILFVVGAVVVVGVAGKLILIHSAIHAVMVPQVVVALMAAVVFGRAPAVIVAITTATCIGMALHFSLVGIVVWSAGGVVAALVVRRRHRVAVLSAGILVGIAQAVATEACRAAGGQLQDAQQLWAAGQAFLGGMMAGPLALIALPFVQFWMGQTPQGQLKVLGDFSHPLIRRLRERSPDVFAHAVRVVDLADHAAKAIGADRQLTRVGALIHDIGKVTRPDNDLETAPAFEDWLQQRNAHIMAGILLVQEYRLPAELLAFIVEHHGTLVMPTDDVELPPNRQDADVRSELASQFMGRLPQTIETAVVMVASCVEHETRDMENGQGASKVVWRVLRDLTAQFQFVACGITQRQIRTMHEALVDYLERSR